MSDDRLVVGRIEQLTVDKTAIPQGQAVDKTAETQGRYSALMLSLADYFADRQHAKIIVE